MLTFSDLPLLPSPFTPTMNDADGSVHDEDWVECFVYKVGNSSSGSQNVSQGQLSELGNTEENATPPRTEKIKNSSSTNSLAGLLALV